jgi:glutaconyl-CoA/methylmalonyl-CoA decarboxylase subunit delta
MTVTELLARFGNPDIIQSLSISDKLMASLITTILGMGITFVALIILQFIISIMDKILNNSKATTNAAATVTLAKKSPVTKAEPQQDDNELVAVIASVIAMKLKTSVGNIVIKNIEKTEDHSPAWNRAGIIEQMNSRF